MVPINVSCHDLQENHFPNIELNRLTVNSEEYVVFGKFDGRIGYFLIINVTLIHFETKL